MLQVQRLLVSLVVGEVLDLKVATEVVDVVIGRVDYDPGVDLLELKLVRVGNLLSVADCSPV